MKNFEINNAELQALNEKELKQIDGGIFGLDDAAIIAGVAAWVVCEVIDGCIRYAAGERKR